MRHRNRTWKLGRNAAHRKATRRNLVAALFRHERIVTTVPKAKAFRPFAERLISLARERSLHRYRRAIALLGGDEEMAKKLFDVLGPRFRSRPGGYTRILRLPKHRHGDQAALALFELVERTPKEKPPEGKKGERKKAKAKDEARREAAAAGAE